MAGYSVTLMISASTLHLVNNLAGNSFQLLAIGTTGTENFDGYHKLVPFRV